MEPNKFEKQLKKQLQNREIKPSAEAWGNISEQLELSATPKTIRFQWYGIAASFIGILLAGVLYFTSQEPSTLPATKITDVKKEASPLQKAPNIIQNEKNTDDNTILATKMQEKKSIQSKSERQINISTKNALASSKNEGKRIEKVVIPLNASKEHIDTKIAEVVAQVELLEQENSTVTDAAIDSLLRGAQQQLLENKIFENDRSVDAMALLADVEDELDQSFRDQIFDALKDGFYKVRTAVADRNK